MSFLEFPARIRRNWSNDLRIRPGQPGFVNPEKSWQAPGIDRVQLRSSLPPPAFFLFPPALSSLHLPLLRRPPLSLSTARLRSSSPLLLPLRYRFVHSFLSAFPPRHPSPLPDNGHDRTPALLLLAEQKEIPYGHLVTVARRKSLRFDDLAKVTPIVWKAAASPPGNSFHRSPRSTPLCLSFPLPLPILSIPFHSIFNSSFPILTLDSLPSPLLSRYFLLIDFISGHSKLEYLKNQF